MPTPDQFLTGFNVALNNAYGNYKITNIDITEQNIVLFNEYLFKIDITFQWQGTTPPKGEDANTMLQQFFNKINSIRIVDSSSGRHYKSTFAWPIGKQATITQENNFNTIHYITEGYSKRVSKAEAERVSNEGTW